MSFVGLEREFSYSALPLAATDSDMADFFRLRMLDGYETNLSAERADLLRGYSQLTMRTNLREGYQLTSRDVILAVITCIDGVLQEQGIKTGFADGRQA